jgi:ferredoxin--NADP+ reductase
MYRIVRNEEIAEDTLLLEIEVPQIAKKVKAGNFVVLRTGEKGERIPMSVTDFDPEKGTITIVFKAFGKTTKDLSLLKAGESLKNVTGPLGDPTEIRHFGTVVCVGGGTGIASIYPVAREMKKAGNKVLSVMAARSRNFLIFEDELKDVSDEVHIATDDGSCGAKGFASDVLQKLIDTGLKIDRVITVGPPIMMKMVAKVTQPYGIKTIASLNPIMVDGTGMCGCCRVIVDGRVRFACVDGPEFDAHLVDFDNMMLRNNRFLEEERKAMESGGVSCGCRKNKK